MIHRGSASVFLVTLASIYAANTIAAPAHTTGKVFSGQMRVRRGLAADIVARHLGEIEDYAADEDLTNVAERGGLFRRQSGTSGQNGDKYGYAQFIWTETWSLGLLNHVLVDTGSSDTWITSPFVSTGMTSLSYPAVSIPYAWGTVQNVVQKSMLAGKLSVGNMLPNLTSLAYIGWVDKRTDTQLDNLGPNLAGVLGLGSSNIAKLSSTAQWQQWCPITGPDVYYLNLPQSQFVLCSTMPSNFPVKLTLPFDTRSQRGVVTTSSISFQVPNTNAINVPSGNALSVLFDTGSPYIIVPYDVARQVAVAVNASLGIRRRDLQQVTEISEVASEDVHKIFRRQRPCPCDGGWPSMVAVNVTRFVIPCTWKAATPLNIAIGGTTFTLPSSTASSAYVYQDADYQGLCFSAIVGYNVTTFQNKISESSLTDFSIFGVPFFQASVVQWDYTNKNVKLALKP